jgi:transmembrane sensor
VDKTKSRKARHGDRRRRTQAATWWVKLRSTEPTAKDVAAWLHWHERDPRNDKAYEDARNFAGRIRATDAKALAGLVAEFALPRQPARLSWRGWSMRFGAMAAALCAAAVGWMLAVRHTEPTRLQYRTDVAMNRAIALPDGSSLVLGADSRLSASFTAAARGIELRSGEAYFKVKHDVRRPFYVRAGNLEIRDIGTAFDVRKTGARVRVTVTRGHVEITEIGVRVAGTGVEVNAGQQVLYTPGIARLRVTAADPATVLGWRQNHLQFVDAPLSSVVANINRYARRPLRIGDPAVGRLSFTGTVNLNGLDRWLAGLQTVFPVTVEFRTDSDVIMPAHGPVHP